MLPASLLLWGCASSSTSTEPLSTKSTTSTSVAIPLDRSTSHITSVALRPSTYQEANVIPVTSGWKLVGTQDGIRIWETALPIRSRSLFFHSAPAGMKLLRRDNENDEWNISAGMRFNKRIPSRADTWNMSSHSLRVHRRPKTGTPKAWEYAVHYPKAEQRERILADTNTKDPKAYVLRQQQIDDETRHGLYLPAPSSITYTIDVPDTLIGCQILS